MNISRNSPIAIIDSGIGGLSLLKSLTLKYANENYIYLADNAYMPYGNKGANFIKSRILELTNYLYENYNVKLVILGCNTASVTAIKYVQLHSPVQIIGLDLNQLNLSQDYAIICTKLSSKGYKGLNTKTCNKLAQNIEENIFDKPTLKRKIKLALTKANIQQNNLVLGCTHYELVANIFKQLTSKNLILPCKQFVKTLKLDKPNILGEKGSVLMLATLPTKSYIDKLWKIFKD